MKLHNIDIDHDLEWADEFNWSPRDEGVDYSITGTLVLEPSALRLAGRPITLQSANDRAWITRATLEALQATLAGTSAMTLTLWDAREFSVGWRYGETPIEATELWPGAGYFVVTLRLRTL